MELSDDGTGALPIIRGIILQDQKAATYKLALLRVIARIADQSAALGRHNENNVELPLGLIALYWIRMYKPLIKDDIPQAPRHQNWQGLGFVKQAFREIAAISPFEFRPGGSFAPPMAHWVTSALADAAFTIKAMPARYLTYPDGGPIFPTFLTGRPRIQRTDRISIDSSFLWSYGTTSVPMHLWMALRRLSAWIEPMLLAEWARLIGGYAKGQQRDISLDAIHRSLRWISPERDTLETRRVIKKLLNAGQSIYCIWTGDRLNDIENIEIDHGFPFSAWPCDDLWNLLPTSRRANQIKRDRLVTANLLQKSECRIREWSNIAYLDPGEPLRIRQFNEEARSSLPIDRGIDVPVQSHFGLAEAASANQFASIEMELSMDTSSIFEAMQYQRLRIYQDQRLPEWDGIKRL